MKLIGRKIRLDGEIKEYLRFSLPVVAENMLITCVSLIYSYLTGTISRSSLAAGNTITQAMGLISSLFTMINVGSTILTAQLTGQKNRTAVQKTVENAMLMAPVLSVAMGLILFAFNGVTCRLLMPAAEAGFYDEGRTFYLINLLSLPFLVITNVAAGVLRAAGKSKPCLTNTIISNIVYVACMFLFTKVLKMGIAGIGWAIVACRVSSGAILTFATVKEFEIDIKRLLKPQIDVIKRILKLGIYSTVDSVAVQLGYVIINSLLVSLGTLQAGINSNLNAVLTFVGIFQTIASVTATTLVGQKVGAGEIQGARRVTNGIFFITQIITLLLCLPAVLFPTFAAGLFTNEADILKGSADFMWIMIPYCFLALGVNVYEPAVKASGDVKFCMILTAGCIWCIRIPLTLLFCVKLGWGVRGVYAANMTSHTVRLVGEWLRMKSEKFGTKRI